MRRALGLAAVCFSTLAGCGQAPHLAPRMSAMALSVSVSPARQLQAISHRWQANDIHEYIVTLRRWDGQSFVDLSPALRVSLPQKTATPLTRAHFANLRQGLRYQIAVEAWGNVGGSASHAQLNATTACTAEIDLGGTQDVESEHLRSMAVKLDPAPFSGTSSIRPINAPSGTDGYDLALEDLDAGATRFVGQYLATQTMTLERLKIGVRYRVQLTARAGTIPLATAYSGTLYHDPAGQDLEQDVVLSVTF